MVVVCFPVVSAKVGLYLLYMHNYYVPYRYLISRFRDFQKIAKLLLAKFKHAKCHNNTYSLLFRNFKKFRLFDK